MLTIGQHANVPMQQYVEDPVEQPSLNASIAHALLTQSPAHAKLQHPRLNPAWEPEAMPERVDIGSIAHAILLEGSRSVMAIIEAEDWRTKEAKAQRDHARQAGKIPVLRKHVSRIDDMVSVAQTTIVRAFPDVWKEREVEQTYVWQENGVYCRCRPDLNTKDKRVILDYKTTEASAEPKAWARGPMRSCGNDLQAALVLRGITTLFKPKDCTFIFMVQETEAPYAVAFVSLDPAYLELGARKISRALAIWKTCRESGEWPGYPLQPVYIEPLAWEVMEEEGGQ